MDVDVVIIGAGPGGLQLGHDLAKRDRPFVVLERGSSVGTFFKTFPRHRKLISVNKLHTGYEDERRMRFDWNSLLSDDDASLFRRFSEDYFPSADAMVEYLQHFAARHVPSIELCCEVTTIEKDGERFRLTAADGRTISARAVVMATGVAAQHKPPIPGLELAESYATLDVSVDRFEGKRVLIIGKGNSAFETADAMMHKAALIHLVSPSPIRHAWSTHYPGHLRAVNNNFLDTYHLKIQNALLDAQVRRLRRAPDGGVLASFSYRHAAGEIEDVRYDHVIACAGFEMDNGPFTPDTAPAMTIGGRFPALTSEFESINVRGLYFAGTLTQSLDYRKTNSAFVHGFRYNSRALALILENKLYGTPVPCKLGPVDAGWLSSRVLDRINRSSAQWQQFGFVGDAVVLSGTALHYYEDLPVQYVHDSPIGRSELYAIVTLEFGSHDGDVFAVPRAPDVDSAAESYFLHPVLQVFSRGVLIRKHHLLENLFGEWEHAHVHERPLRDFLRSVLI